MEQANTYKLTMTLENNMLSVVLLDFIDWVSTLRPSPTAGKAMRPKCPSGSSMNVSKVARSLD
jgi:hypothetical protein